MEQTIRDFCCLLKGVDGEQLIDTVKSLLPSNPTDDDYINGVIGTCSSKLADHPNYDVVTKHFFLNSLYKSTPDNFADAVAILHENEVLNNELYECVMMNKAILNAAIDHTRDYDLTYFGLKTMHSGYLSRVGSRVIERPQYMFMRVSVGIHGSDIMAAIETYNLMSQRYMIHATPTLFNSGALKPQFSSCYLAQVKSDAIDGIYDTLKWCAKISQHAGGIGLAVHKIRPKGARIRGTNGVSDGIIPMLRVFNATARYVNQAGKRNGSIAVFLEPWHGDIEEFLQLRKNYGNEEQRTRDLFTAMWMPDLFMKRVEADAQWTLMCPHECPNLHTTHGEEFERLYERYEAEGKGLRTVSARSIWQKMVESQIETGMPYVLYKDSCNKKSNQKNLGTIQNANLCTEIVEYTSPEEVSVCNLASVGLPMFVEDGAFNHEKLHGVVKVATRNLNKVIDRNYYPVDESRTSNMKHRPIGVGVQGLADVFAMLDMPFESAEAAVLNEQIFETIYHGALEASVELAKVHGVYDSFPGSPTSEGILQFDMWGVKPSSGRYDWDAMKEDVKKNGLRNSLLIALMPTASTSAILGFNECFEPVTSNIYKRTTLSGEYVVVNRYLISKLIELDLWDLKMKERIIADNGSVQNIAEIPEDVRAVFKTAWEIKQKTVLDLAIQRSPYVCQSQSMNVFISDPDYGKLTAMHFYGWKNSIKTSSYYVRSRAKAHAQKFTIEPTQVVPEAAKPKVVCTDEVCVMCSA